MPLRDHFKISPRRHPQWESFAYMLTVGCVIQLCETLPEDCRAEPRAGGDIRDEDDFLTSETAFAATAMNGEVPPAQSFVWQEWARRSFQALVYSDRISHRLAAVFEMICPVHKEDPATRQAFVTRCAAHVQAGTSVALLDIVTTVPTNLYAELMRFLGLPAPTVAGEPDDLYAVVLRPRFFQDGGGKRLEVTAAKLTVGEPLPKLPLTLEHDAGVLLDLESAYERACRDLRIPSS